MQRDLPLDALRTLAVLGMMATHTTRLIPLRERWDIQLWAMRLEPIIPALFLALAGASFMVSQARAEMKPDFSGSGHARRHLLRALMLWGISMVFYLADEGWRWPDALLAPGILATIGGAMAVLTAAMALPKPARPWGLALALLGGVALYVICDLSNVKMVWLTSGNSPVLPLWLFACGGALYAGLTLGYPRVRKSDVGWVLFALGLALFGWLVFRYGLEPLFSKPLGRSDAARIFTEWRDGAEKTITIGYYNLRPILSAAVLGLVLALHQALRGSLNLVSNEKLGQSLGSIFTRTITWFCALGRHSLGVYILHLALLAILVVTGGKRPLPTGAAGFAVYAGLIGICLAYAHGREAWAKQRRAVRPLSA